MKIINTLTDESILAEIGERIARRRLEVQLTQAALMKRGQEKAIIAEVLAVVSR